MPGMGFRRSCGDHDISRAACQPVRIVRFRDCRPMRRREEALSNNPPELISVDWGTSSLRAYLADADGRALAEIAAEKGALSLHAGEHETYLASLLQDWKTQYPN